MMKMLADSRVFRGGARSAGWFVVTGDVELSNYEWDGVRFDWNETVARGISVRSLTIGEGDFDAVLDVILRRDGGATRVARALAQHMTKVDKAAARAADKAAAEAQ